jgi:prepilin-type N-terminal cleavage/methylation domain-containing protein
MIKAFTLIELLVVLVIMGILSSLGVVGYNSYVDSSNDAATKNNYNKITKVLEAEFAKCKLNKNSKILDNHSCASPPTISLLDNYFTNTQKLKNSYNQNNKVIQNDICTPGGVTIKTTNTGVYETAYFSQKNNTKNTSNINSTWAQKFTDTTSTSVSFSCAQTANATPTAPVVVQTIYSYKPPHNGAGAGIIVDENGNMLKGQGAHACGADCFNGSMPTWYTTDSNGNRIYPGKSGSNYRWVMTEGASASGNIASACANGNCKYNFSDNTFTVINSGKTYKAGESIDTIYK